MKQNRGSAGVDWQTITHIMEQYGEQRFLEEIQQELKQGTYHPRPVRRVTIPKGDGRKRPLGIPTIRDRTVQMAVKLVIEPIFEADFLPCSYGFRPKRSAHQAIKKIQRDSRHKGWVVDLDIRSYFDHVNHQKLLKLVEQRISDRRIVKMIRKWLEAGVLDRGQFHESQRGTPQGGHLSSALQHLSPYSGSSLGEEVRPSRYTRPLCGRPGGAL